MALTGPHFFDVRIRVEVTDGNATRTEIEDALCNQLDLEIETSESAVLSLVVTAAAYAKRATL